MVGCVHRHYYVAQLSQLFCARVRQEYDDPESPDRLTVEQVRSAMNVWLSAADTTPAVQKERYKDALEKQRYHQRRNEQARKSHTKTNKLNASGIDVRKIKSCVT